MSEAENEEITRGGALPEGIGDLFDVGVRHGLCAIGSGGVVDEGLD